MIICAGDIESFDFAKSIGIGMIESSINLTKLCINNSPKSLIFVGSAGSYGRYNLFDIVYSHKASNIESSFLNNQSYTPINNTIALEEFGNYKSNTIVNSSNYITTDNLSSKKALDKKIDIENMEFYSVASVAKHFNLPFLGIFIITNFTNKNASNEFKKNHKTALIKLKEHIKTSLKI
jgi:nucleoside phosphorylase